MCRCTEKCAAVRKQTHAAAFKVYWEWHAFPCGTNFHFLVLITLFRQLEQEQSKNRSQVDEAQVLRHQNQSLRADNAKLMVAVERAQEELENSRQANR